MKVAYLVNQYPHVSHSFIRREIAALEQHGVNVERFSVRPTMAKIVDPDDQQEQAKTHVLLGSKGALIGAFFAVMCTRPGRFFTALRLTWTTGRRSETGVLRHLIYLVEACGLAKHLESCGAQHLHAHFGTNPATVALLAHVLSGIPYSFTVHGPEEFDHPEELSLGLKIQHAAFVVAISEFGRSQLYRWCSFDHWGKIQVVHCGVDAAFLAGGPQPLNETNKLVCVGRLAEQKGQLLLLESLPPLVKEGIPFTMTLAGDGDMRGVIEKRIQELGLQQHVGITGWVSGERVKQELLAARVMVLPSFAEGLPVVIMEALALGRPVVTTYVAGIPELVIEGKTGWLIPAGSVERLTEALRQALRAPLDQLRTMGEAGAKRVALQHDVIREAEHLAALFKSRTELHA